MSIPEYPSSPRPLDTSEEAHRVQLEVLRRLGPEGRFRMACELSDQLRVHLREGIRLRHPAYSEAEVTLALIRLTAGEELFRRVAPDATVVP